MMDHQRREDHPQENPHEQGFPHVRFHRLGTRGQVVFGADKRGTEQGHDRQRSDYAPLDGAVRPAEGADEQNGREAADADGEIKQGDGVQKPDDQQPPSPSFQQSPDGTPILTFACTAV
jgi:hypothetical protein